MIVYADILIILNWVVDYFLLLAAGLLIRIKPKLLRIILSAFLGGVSSLYIFLPQSPIFTELIVRVTICAVMVILAFGFITAKDFLRNTGIFFGITCLYAGIMTALWHILKPSGMVINNSVVYFDISAIALIIYTVIFYFAFLLLAKLFGANGSMAKCCDISLVLGEDSIEIKAMLDTGNSLNDIFGNGEIIIVDKKVAQKLLGNTNVEENPLLKSRYRVVPLNTVSGTDMLEGFRCDSAVAVLGREKVYLRNPIVAISKSYFDSGINGIVNPKIFGNAVYENVSNNKKVYK